MDSRRVINGSGSTPPVKVSKEAEPPKATTVAKPSVASEPIPSRRYEAHNTGPEEKGRHSRRMPFIGGIIIVVLVGVIAWLLLRPVPTVINSKQYQAVCFADGQCYFGKLSALNDQFMKLTEVYYLKTQTEKTEGVTNPANQSDVQLVKLGTGNEIHDPEDAMIIAKNQVLYYENLKIDSRVSQAIDRYKKTSEAN